MDQKEVKKKVFVEFPADMVTARTNNMGQEFYSVTLPKGTEIGGEDFGHWSFTQTKMFPSKFHEGALVASFPNADWEINLSKSYKDGEGEWQRETARVRVGALVETFSRKGA